MTKDENDDADHAEVKASSSETKSVAEGKSGAAKQGASGKEGDEKAAPDAAARDAHGAPKPSAQEHGAHAAGGHGHTVNRKEVWTIFVILFVLTVLEVALAQLPGISRKLMVVGLVGLAVTKAACVGLYYMHLKNETRSLRLTVALPLVAPPVYALVLIAEAAWRFTG